MLGLFYGFDEGFEEGFDDGLELGLRDGLDDLINACYWKGCLMQQVVDTKLTPKNHSKQEGV
jgi:hypothetical protein